MRRYIKQDLINLIEQLSNVNETFLKKGNAITVETVQEILTDCQQGAVDVGTKIEECEGEGTNAVAHLEEYCEKLYFLCVNWQDFSVREKELKALRSLLNKIKNSILYDIPDSNKEVVFLPYKASMWDSLESVWIKACEDENCDVYVIPIPYYDKNPDGSFGEMHYEGDLYPENVSVTHFEEYDFESRRPDVVFIHNPYDDTNYVTSIHPYFYAQNLKQFTETLVYIPYFVLREVDPDDEKDVEKMAHLCTTPGVFYADKVIVQSEQMRQVYIKVLNKFMGADLEDKNYWKNKILGLGSPKIDKIKRSTKEEQVIPDEWKKVLCDKEGKWKKVILYNTTVDGLLKNDEKMLKKITDSLDIFYKNKEEIALLWRPHPLVRATIQSMRPELLEEYDAIVENYIRDGWGIYDDTAELNRAIVISDAYYGDWSSLVELYRHTEKPIMIQNVKIFNKD